MKIIARRYAKALFQLATTAAEKEQYYKDLSKFKGWMLGSSNLTQLLENPMLPKSLAKSTFLEICTRGEASKILTNFFMLIIDEGRLRALPAIIEAYEDLYYADNNIAKASIESAHELPKGLQDAFQKSLETHFKTTLISSFKVNRSLLGGFRVNVGSHQIDASLMTQLSNLSRTLKRAS